MSAAAFLIAKLTLNFKSFIMLTLNQERIFEFRRLLGAQSTTGQNIIGHGASKSHFSSNPTRNACASASLSNWVHHLCLSQSSSRSADGEANVLTRDIAGRRLLPKQE